MTEKQKEARRVTLYAEYRAQRQKADLLKQQRVVWAAALAAAHMQAVRQNCGYEVAHAIEALRDEAARAIIDAENVAEAATKKQRARHRLHLR